MGKRGREGRVEGACSKASVISRWQTSYFNVTLSHTQIHFVQLLGGTIVIHISMLTIAMHIIITSNLYIVNGQITAKNSYTTQH